MYRAGNSVEQVFGGTVIKQGDRTPLGFNFRTENGELVSLTGATVQVKIASDKGVVLEKQATISDEYTVQFAIGSQDITGAGDMRIEFTVTYPGGTIEKFPSDDWQRIRITPTLEDVEKYGVGYITFEKLTDEFQNQFDEFTGGVDQQIDYQKQRVDNLIKSTPQPSEVIDARFDESGNSFTNLKEHLDDKGNKINILSENGIHVESFKIIAPESNDSARFQRAVNKANTSGTRIVILKNNKTYNVPTKITSYDDLIFIGFQSKIAGGGATKFMDAMNRNLFIGINFDGYNFVVQADGKEKVSFERCKFTNIGIAAVYYYGAKNSYVTNCEFNNITKSSIVVDNDGDNIWIMNSTFDNPSEFGGYAVEQNDCAHVNVLSGTRVFVFNNPKIKNNGGQGILFGYNSSLGKGARHCKAIGNYCEGNGQEGITSFGGSNKVAYQNTIALNTSKNNRFHQIEIWQSDDNTVTGNTVDESNTYGSMGALTLYNTKGTIASDNKVLNASNNGVAILAGSDRLVVKNTTIKGTNGKNDTSTATKGHGILLDSNGVAQPTNILLKDVIIESIDTVKTSSNNKFGVYSTSNSLQGNTIKDINTTGYANNVHLFAKNTTKHMSSTKPSTVTGYDTYVENIGALAEAGTTGSKYVVRGWLQVGGVFVDDRMITGN